VAMLARGVAISNVAVVKGMELKPLRLGYHDGRQRRDRLTRCCRQNNVDGRAAGHCGRTDVDRRSNSRLGFPAEHNAYLHVVPLAPQWAISPFLSLRLGWVSMC
jgi:hypothetical protein